MTEWVRLWHDMPTDPKWRTIARKSKQRVGDVIAVFNFLMVNASANVANRGVLDAFEAEDVATALDLDDDDVRAIVAAMQGKVLDGDRLSGWERRQPKREDSAAERTRQWRERKAAGNVTQRMVTHGDASVTQRDAPESETETYTEKESTTPESVTETAREARRHWADPELDPADGAPMLRVIAALRGATMRPAGEEFLEGWLRDGIDLETIIVPAIEATVTKRVVAKLDIPKSLKYYDNPVREAAAAAAAKAASDDSLEARNARFAIQQKAETAQHYEDFAEVHEVLMQWRIAGKPKGFFPEHWSPADHYEAQQTVERWIGWENDTIYDCFKPWTDVQRPYAEARIERLRAAGVEPGGGYDGQEKRQAAERRRAEQPVAFRPKLRAVG